MEKQEKLVLIDGNSIINRAFYALPLLSNSEGEFSNAVYGFCNIIIKIIEQEKPKYVAVAFDVGGPTFRHNIYADYKAGRKKMPDELASQLPILKSVLSSMNIKFIEKSGIEADDIIGTIAKKFDVPTIVVSGDRDLFQLVDQSTTVWFTKKGISEILAVTPQNIKEVYGVEANQVADYKALMGDSSDNIKGVAGIGTKTAQNLIDQFGNIDGVYQNLDKLKGKILENLSNGKEDAYLSKKLATIDTNADIEVELGNLEYDFPFGVKTLNLFKNYEFNSILKKSELFNNSQIISPKKVVNIKELTNLEQIKKLADNLTQTAEIALWINDGKMHISNSRFEENIIDLKFVELTLADVIAALKKVLENENISKCTINSKWLKAFARDNKFEICGIKFDCNLAKYLLSGSKKTDLTSNQLCEEFEYEPNCVASCMLFAKEKLLNALQTENMQTLYFDIEMPLVDVLLDMEHNGFKVDKNNLTQLSDMYKQQLDELSAKIHMLTGYEFNIKSPKQVNDVLFNKLQLKRPRGAKTSVDVAVLEKIINQHPSIEYIIEFRKIEKLYDTYLEPFADLTDEKTGLIHTVFNQTLTSTGRLSSSEPNLQNIPVRDERGKNLRKVFVPRDIDGTIVTSDYSQIELRLLAHYSQDPKLIEAYQKGIDIHSQTASTIFGLPLEMVTPDLRRKAKTVNFGILYGMSDYGLSQSLKVSREEARYIIDRYFENFSHVKDYMNGSVEKARNLGFASTLFGRKRKIDDINSANYLTRQFGERAAMNMPLQGTASDIIKIAMVKVYNELKKRNLKSKLILQIHDELIVDCANGEQLQVEQILKDCMSNAVKLSVPLEVDIQSGKTWFDAK